jgi:hypothetical protein
VKRPDEKTVKALRSLRGNLDFEVVVAWMKEGLQEIFVEQGQFSADPARYPFLAGRNAELSAHVKEIAERLDEGGHF